MTSNSLLIRRKCTVCRLPQDTTRPPERRQAIGRGLQVSNIQRPGRIYVSINSTIQATQVPQGETKGGGLRYCIKEKGSLGIALWFKNSRGPIKQTSRHHVEGGRGRGDKKKQRDGIAGGSSKKPLK